MADYDDDEPKESGTEDEKILAQARRDYKLCVEADGDNRADAIHDLKFLKGGENQWEDMAVAARKRDGRPIITVNDLPSMLHQVTNDQRQNTPSIKVHPVDDEADPETAKTIQGLIRHIEYGSHADVAKDTAVNSAAAIGFGYFSLITDWCEEDSCDQDIKFQRIRNALSVRVDPLSIEPDGGDMNFGFIEFLMNREDFKEEHPDAKANNTSYIQEGGNPYAGWLSDHTVLVCNYYRIKKTKETVVELSNGESGFKSDLLELPEGVTITRKRDGERRQVMLYKITGVDVLEKTEIKFKRKPRIPLYPVYGDEIDIEGKVTRFGIIRNAKGPCASYNVMMSGATEEVALRSKNPYMMAEGQEEGHEDEFAQANQRSFPYLTYKMTELNGHLAPPPQRQPMTDIPAGMIALAMHAQDNKKKTTGLFDASLGAKGTATSGVQEKAQQREGDMANFHYADGLVRTMIRCGQDIVNMIPCYYDAERTVRILGEDNTAEHVTLNQPNVEQKPDKTGVIREVLNNVTVGTYDVTVSAGASYTTLRQEAAEGMAENMAKNPALWSVIGDLYVKNQDWPGADEMAQRIKKTIPPQILEDEENDDPMNPANQVIQTPKGPLPVSQVPQALEGLEMQLMQAGEQLKAADGAKQQAEMLKQQSEILKQQNEAEKLRLDGERLKVEQFNAETDRERMERESEVKRQQAIADAEKSRSEQMKAESDAMRTAEDASQKEFDTAQKEKVNGVPTLDQIAELIESSRHMPSGMLIKSRQSGQTYEVDFKPPMQ